MASRPGLARARGVRRHRRLYGGDPDDRRRLAASRHPAGRHRALLRDRLAARLSGAAGPASLPRLRDARLLDPRLPGVPQRGMADEGHLRPDDEPAGLVRVAALVLLSVPRLAWRRIARHLVADPLAMGPRLHGIAREPDPRPLARHRYAALHADGVRHRLDARRRLRRALRAARRVRRPDAVRALARHPDDGDRRRRRLLLRTVPRRADRGAAAGVAALHARVLPDPLRAP